MDRPALESNEPYAAASGRTQQTSSSRSGSRADSGTVMTAMLSPSAPEKLGLVAARLWHEQVTGHLYTGDDRLAWQLHSGSIRAAL